jgi:hypothetical protein
MGFHTAKNNREGRRDLSFALQRRTIAAFKWLQQPAVQKFILLLLLTLLALALAWSFLHSSVCGAPMAHQVQHQSSHAISLARWADRSEEGAHT